MMDMRREVIDRAVREIKDQGFDISDEEIHRSVEYCLRKMKVAGKEEDYFELLFPDVLKEYVVRKLINTIGFLCMMEVEDVQCLFKESLR